LKNIADNTRWSFGNNRLQIKAETHVLVDVQMNLVALGRAALSGGLGPKLQAKQELLSLLIANEHSRLEVWLSPLDAANKHHFTFSNQAVLPDVGNKSRDVRIRTNVDRLPSLLT
jgi:phosphatidylinositol 4-kinase